MSTTPETAPKPVATNSLGYPLSIYKGAESTLCAGCGHESITVQLVKALYEMNVEPWNVAKMSGIGCSSKTTAYFLGQSHGFNGVHGRMASMATGSYVANRKLVHVGVSGDGDTASIGLGNFLHAVRRNMQIVYLVENNGVYALTKGQFSATADKGTSSKKGFENEMQPIDICALAINMGCQYVARSFSGDVRQLQALIKGALSHPGFSVIDVISPCITFNNHEGSKKSLKYAKEHEEPLHEIGFVPFQTGIQVDYKEGEQQRVDFPDGSHIVLKKLGVDYDCSDKPLVFKYLRKAQEEDLLLTGLLYHDPGECKPMADQLHMIDVPLTHMPTDSLRPGPDVLDDIMRKYL